MKVVTGFTFLICLLSVSVAYGQSPRVLYTFAGDAGTAGWQVGNGTGLLDSDDVEGALIYEEFDPLEMDPEIQDDTNLVTEFTQQGGGLDITGMESIEFDLEHDGDEPVPVQFFVKVTINEEYVPLGDPIDIEPDGMATYAAPLTDLLPYQIAYIKRVGFSPLPHAEQGPLVWKLYEVRTAGEPLEERFFATHEPGSPDNGLNGAFGDWNVSSIEGNDGGQNQTGLRHNTSDLPPGNTGSLQWTDLNSGAAVSWANGQEHQGNSWNEKPTDMSNYTEVTIRMAATNVVGGAVEEVDITYRFQTSDHTTGWFDQAAGTQTLPADGEFHELFFPISHINDLDMINVHYMKIGGHGESPLVIDVDYILARKTELVDCNDNGVPDVRDLVTGSSQDCNFNAIPDECDIRARTSNDCNRNGIPDDCDIADQESVRVIYTWDGTGDTQRWDEANADADAFFSNAIEGELTIEEESDPPGSGIFLQDDGNLPAEGATTEGGLDLTGMRFLEFEMGHDGGGDISVQPFVSTTGEFIFNSLGNIDILSGEVATYRLPLKIPVDHLSHVRSIGLNIFADHSDVGNVAWTIREIRAVGAALTQRDYATHGPNASDNGLQGAIVDFDIAAVQGNDGGQNQTGLSHNTSDTPPGNTGSLQWTDLPGQGGGAISWRNGTAFSGNTFDERPTDMSTYNEIVVRMAATNLDGGSVASVGVQYFLQTGNFNYFAAGDTQSLPVDGEFHELIFPLDGIEDLQYVDGHGINLDEHEDGAVIIDVDNIRARGPGTLIDADTNQDGIPDECAPAEIFKRGDSNANGTLDIGDPIINLGHQFLGDQVVCRDALDYNDSGTIDISDPVANLSHQFLGLAPPAAPGKESCGPDPTEDPFECADYPGDNC